ncbi:MAG: histidine kinase [Treponema sp.]|nr:histidine kinase [Treponema sp.]
MKTAMINKKLESSIQIEIILILVISMSLMLVLQGTGMEWYTQINNRIRQEYIATANENMAVSLRTIGENISSMAVYAASFESFKSLYIPNRTIDLDTADKVYTAFQTVRFITSFYPIVLDVVVVGLNEVATSYYIGYSYDFVELMRPMYDFRNPFATESRFFYFNDQNYFIYVTPIADQFSSIGSNRKIASCIFICNLDYIRRLANINAGGSIINFSIYDEENMLISGRNNQEVSGNIIESTYVDNMGLTVVTSGSNTGLTPERNETNNFMWIFFVSSILLLVIITIMVIILLRMNIVKPISDLVGSLKSEKVSSLHTRLNKSRIREIDHIVDGVNHLLDEIELYIQKSIKANEKIYELEIRKNETEIYALQSQINPHFLNNTLQCIRSIAITHKVTEIADISLAMSELFQYSMNYEEKVLVRDEISIVRQYILITNIRFRNRFSFNFDIDPLLNDSYMCRMILQPLVENAVRHGVSRLENGGQVNITGRLEGKNICFEVSDDGPGFEENELVEIRKRLNFDFSENREHYNGSSFGLYNINRRLKLNYGDDFGIKIDRINNTTIIRINFPN